jgi:hypothetical protein
MPARGLQLVEGVRAGYRARGTTPARGWAWYQPCTARPCTSGGLAALASQRQTGLGRTLPAHELPTMGVGKLAPVVHEEAT